MVIIYPIGDQIAAVFPAGSLPLEEVARKDVPAGVPYLIVDDTDLPDADQSLWQADFSQPHGYGIGAEAWFAEQEAVQ